MTKEAMKLALEALENAQANVGEWWPEAITALREALAEQPAQQEPVRPCTHPSLGACSLREDGTASRWNCVMCGTEFVPKATQRWAEFNETTKRNIEHAKWYLSTHPQPAQQEPVATLWQHGRTGRTRITMPGDITDCDADWFKAADLYTPPPAQRTWVGLTDEEIDEWTPEIHSVIRAIEAKLKEKNT